ncbi:MAG TPA: ferritin-like domain-containing protein [Candidatus Binatia bacterium]|nr:ferritin-like domain-containing protein [Candidatus Binatia bacterium]
MKNRQLKNAKTESAEAELFFNRTGIMAHPDLSVELIRAAKKTVPSLPRDGKQIAAIRAGYLNENLPIGSAPVIVVNGSEKAGEEELSADADRMSVLLDKLGERLAFERQGTRLYEAFLQKLESAPAEHESGPSTEDLRHICNEELEHFKLLQRAISGVGGDATVQTPSADIAGVLSRGIIEIVSDPRTTIPQTLQAILNAELADNDGWQMLKDLAGELGYSDLEEQCEKALQEEQEHLENVRTWLSEMTLAEALGEEALFESDAADSEPEGERGTRKRRRPANSGSSRSKKRRKK